MKIAMVDLVRTVNGRTKHRIVWLKLKPGVATKRNILVEKKIWKIDAILSTQELVDEFKLIKK